MCLLIHKPANVTFTDEELRDFYTRNQDGYGVMYAEDGKLHSQKALGSVDDWVAFFRSHEHRELCVHLRMRTHGDIDLTNCHPYPVYGFEGEAVAMPMLLMHNGVLATGNAKDPSKSDTWHYIRDWLRPLLNAAPELVHTPQFSKVIGAHIGNNRFALMTHDGRVQIVNKYQGVEYKGAWFSNTYAWSASKFMPRPAQSSLWGGDWRSQSTWSGSGSGAGKDLWGKPFKATPPAKGKAKPAPKLAPLPPAPQPKRVTRANKHLEQDYLEVQYLLEDLGITDVSRSNIELTVDTAGPTRVYALLEGVYSQASSLSGIKRVFTTSSGLAWLKEQTLKSLTEPSPSKESKDEQLQ